MYCPVCASINTGKVGCDTYYCSDCLLEFSISGDEMHIFYIDAEGVSFALKGKAEAQKLVEFMRQGDDLLFQEKLEKLLSKS